MTPDIMKSRLSILTDETDDAVLLTFLDIAADKVLERINQCGDNVTEVPLKYHSTQLEVAAYLLNKRGAEGETAHKENGIDRTYEAASVPYSMLKHVIPNAVPFRVGE